MLDLFSAMCPCFLPGFLPGRAWYTLWLVSALTCTLHKQRVMHKAPVAWYVGDGICSCIGALFKDSVLPAH
jgi:hypothetical protein